MNSETETNKNATLISIGIPTYNRPDELRRTLAEITNQTYSHLEIIISDNASTNIEVEKVIREFMAKDARIQYFRQEKNIGINLNFQFVMEKASGEYFMWAADDDWHEPNFVEALWHEISSDESAVVAFCDFDSRDYMGQPVSGFPHFMSAMHVMTDPSRVLRQIRFFMLKEGTAKPHSIYGLIRRRVLSGFSWPHFVEKYGWNGADALFVFWLMTKGRLALNEQRLFGCTVGNRKDYVDGKAKWGVRRYLIFIAQQVRYLLSYLIIAHGLTRVILIVLLPWKLLGIANLFAIKPGVNYLRRKFLSSKATQ